MLIWISELRPTIQFCPERMRCIWLVSMDVCILYVHWSVLAPICYRRRLYRDLRRCIWLSSTVILRWSDLYSIRGTAKSVPQLRTRMVDCPSILRIWPPMQLFWRNFFPTAWDVCWKSVGFVAATQAECARILLRYGQTLGSFEYEDILTTEVGSSNVVTQLPILNGAAPIVACLKQMGADFDRLDSCGVSPLFGIVPRFVHRSIAANTSAAMTMLERVKKVEQLNVQNKFLLTSLSFLRPSSAIDIEFECAGRAIFCCFQDARWFSSAREPEVYKNIGHGTVPKKQRSRCLVLWTSLKKVPSTDRHDSMWYNFVDSTRYRYRWQQHQQGQDSQCRPSTLGCQIAPDQNDCRR